MKYLKYILLFCLTLFPFTSTSYGLTNSWCSNGKYSKAVSPFPKPSFNNCPAYARVVMTKKDVEEYYINGLGQEYLCDLNKNFLFGLTQRRADYKAIKEMFLYKQDKVNNKCNEINKTKLVQKKAEEAKQKATANINKKPKEWCIGAGKYGKQYPIKKKESCPTHAAIEITSEEATKIFISGTGKKYLTNLIANGDICRNNRTDYKFIRELLKGKKDLGCVKQKTLAEKKSEEEAKIRALAEKLAKEEIARQLKVKQKALAEKKAKEDAAREKALAKKKAEKLAQQKAIAAKKAKEDKARKKALAKENAEELVKQKAIAAKKAKEDELKQKVLNEKIQVIKDEAKFIVATLKEYVTTDTNKLDILEVSELLENYNSEMQKGWSDTTVEKYEELYNYVQKDEGFIEFSADKKSKQLAAYNEEIRQLREYLTTSQSDLKAFITKNLGSNNAIKALKLAKETKQILKDFEVNQAMTLKNNIATWKAMNGVGEDKQYKFKILVKELNIQKDSNKKNKSDVKTVIGIRSSDALNTSPVVDNDEDDTFKKEYKYRSNYVNYTHYSFSNKQGYNSKLRRTEKSINCHYENGEVVNIGMYLWQTKGCTRQLFKPKN